MKNANVSGLIFQFDGPVTLVLIFAESSQSVDANTALFPFSEYLHPEKLPASLAAIIVIALYDRCFELMHTS